LGAVDAKRIANKKKGFGERQVCSEIGSKIV
jgi:hypothetical protein